MFQLTVSPKQYIASTQRKEKPMRSFILSLLLLASFNVIADEVELTPYQENQISCLAQNIFFESGAEPKTGQVAVGMVTMNRVNSGKFPDSVCGVVKQKVKGLCQFSWVCNPSKKINAFKNTNTYKQAHELATHIYLQHEQIPDITKGAMYFHTVYVHPNWTNLKKTTRIGQHIFYKQKESKFKT
jgi:spore germination cell wall hydrolase CwlJ-like protein